MSVNMSNFGSPGTDRSTEIIRDALMEMTAKELGGVSFRSGSSLEMTGLVATIAEEQSRSAEAFGTADEVAAYARVAQRADKMHTELLTSWLMLAYANLESMDIDGSIGTSSTI